MAGGRNPTADALADLAQGSVMTDNIFANRIIGYTTRKASDLAANPLNYRKHPMRQRAAVKASLSELGWIAAVVENVRTGFLIDGHERVWQAMQNDEDVPVLQVDLSEEEERLALATFDPITYMAETDAAALDELLRQTNTGEAALQELMADLAKDAGLYLDKPQVDAEPQIDRAEELRVKWGVEPGDLWQLGDHRLICGDCTDAAVVARVMGGEKAEMGFHDPPYGISFQSNGRTASRKFDVLDGDDEVNGEWLPMAVENVSDDGAMYICTRWDVYPKWITLIEQHMKVKNLIVWDKVDWSSGDLQGDYSPRHEFILFCTNGRHLLRGHRDSNVWAFGAPNKQNYLHPTQKKVEVPSCAIEHSSDAGDIVADWFSGSGTTIIACEQLGRKCRAVEISPGYVAVALQRWADATGKTPERLG